MKAEVLRWLFLVLGHGFSDIRISWLTEWLLAFGTWSSKILEVLISGFRTWGPRLLRIYLGLR